MEKSNQFLNSAYRKPTFGHYTLYTIHIEIYLDQRKKTNLISLLVLKLLKWLQKSFPVKLGKPKFFLKQKGYLEEVMILGKKKKLIWSSKVSSISKTFLDWQRFSNTKN